MIIKKVSSDIRVFEDGQRIIGHYSAHEIQKKFCSKAYEIIEKTGTYDLQECNFCDHKCMSYEVNQPKTGD